MLAWFWMMLVYKPDAFRSPLHSVSRRSLLSPWLRGRCKGHQSSPRGALSSKAGRYLGSYPGDHDERGEGSLSS